MDVIFTIEKIEKSDKLVDTINNLTINYSGYELNTATASDAHGDLMSDPDTVTHTRNRILDQKILIFRTIEKISVFPPPMNPTIRLKPQTMIMPAVK